MNRHNVPRQQLTDPADRMVGDACEHVAQVGLGIEAVQFRGPNQAVERCGARSAGVRPGEELILATNRHRAQGALDCVVVDL